MANTITYDPSDDPQAVAEREATDTENLKIGEDLAREQQELLAGKYKNAEELEKAYIELQQKMGKGDEAAPEEQKEGLQEGQVLAYNADGAVNYETVQELYGEQISTVMEKSGVDPFKMATHFNENNGQLSPEMTKQLVDAGFPEDSVDAYLKGQAIKMGFTSEPDFISQTDVNELQNLAGGKKAYENLTSWAQENLPQEEIQAFDEVINTGNKAAVRFAVRALNAQYEDAVGKQPALVTGKNSTKGDKYRSMAEVVRDMSDPKYEQDEAYRFDVMQKLERSNLKV